MLVQFRFKNFGSFKDEAVFDMRAIKSYKEHPENCIMEDEREPLLRVAAVYGANASGKSNFVSAYLCFLNIVRLSFSGKDKQENKSVLEKHYNPFLFDEIESDDGTEFEAIYRVDGIEYRYGFIYNDQLIKYEWLYKVNLGSKRRSVTTILERSVDSFVLGSSIKSSCEKYIDSVDKDVLALSFFSSLKLKSKVFRNTLYCVFNYLPIQFNCEKKTHDLLDMYFVRDFNETEKANLLRFLEAIDVGIKDIEVNKNKNAIEIFTYHLGNDGSLYRAPFEIESDGTKKAIAVYSLIRIAFLKNKGLIVDELNMQLHPLLVKYVIDTFYSENTQGQLIYTTHDTSLLDRKYFRRDQIWFVEKDRNGVSSLVSLAEFKIRNDSSFEKAYLGGVFGGIPNFSDYFFED